MRTMPESARSPRFLLLAAVAVAGLGALTGCSGGSSGAVTAGTGVTATDTAASASVSAAPSPTGPSTSASSREAGVATVTPVPSSAAATTSASTPVPGTTAGTTAGTAVLVLQTDGLGVLVGPATIRQLPFGSTTLSTLKTVLTNTLGAPKTSPDPECGQGPRTSLTSGSMTALFDGTKFVGWTADSRGKHPYSTADGIGIGSTLAAVRKAYGPVTVTNDSLGPEFSTPSGLGGLLSSTAATGKVVTLYAGETCFFR
jgi:hypothetical protein